MTEHAAAAIHIHLVMVKAKLLHCNHRDHGEGLINFPELNIIGFPARFLQRFFHRVNGRRCEFRRLMRVGGVRDDFGEDFISTFFSVWLTHQHHGGRAVINGARIGSRNGAIFGEDCSQAWNFLGARIFRGEAVQAMLIRSPIEEDAEGGLSR